MKELLRSFLIVFIAYISFSLVNAHTSELDYPDLKSDPEIRQQAFWCNRKGDIDNKEYTKLKRITFYNVIIRYPYCKSIKKHLTK